MSENEEFIREFLEECAENLDQLDEDLVALEKEPTNSRLLENIFRTIHTVKGTSGFFGFAKLGAITHDGESLLGRLRDGELELNQEIATSLLKLVDAIRAILANIRDTGKEGASDFQGLSAELIRLALSPGVSPEEMKGPEEAETAIPPTADTVVEVEQPAQDLRSPHGSRVTPHAELPEPMTGPPSPPTADADVPVEMESKRVIDPGVPARELEAETRGQPSQAKGSDIPIQPEGSIRVDVGLLDELVDLAGELVLARNQLSQFAATSDNRALLNTIQKLSMITSELQEGVMQTRMQPISTIWGKFPRLVRDLALRCEKDIRLEQFGEDTELDRTLLEAIRDPLTHLIRNAVDHGVEPPAVRQRHGKPRQGYVQLRAYHESGQVHMEITDDGGGIDLQRVRQRALDRGLISTQQAGVISDHELSQLIFLPGFSTAEQVTAVSGRGVGMDVVRTNVEQVGGSIELQNRPGLGTTVRITIPLTLAIIPALIVTCQTESFAIPQVGVLELLSFPAETAAQAIEWVHDTPVYRLRGQLLPIVHLAEVLQFPPATNADRRVQLVVLQNGGRPFGLVVDEVINTQEIVVKPMGRLLQGIPVFVGATILGDGTVALILDATGLSRQAGLPPSQAPATDRTIVPADNACGMSRPVVLCEIAAGRRIAIRLENVERLEEFSAVRLEQSAGQPAVQYGGEVMPLIDAVAILETGDAASAFNDDTVRLVVGRGETGSVGLIVSRILDIVDCPQGTQVRADEYHCVTESVVIADRITDVIDWNAVLQKSAVPVSVAAGVELTDELE